MAKPIRVIALTGAPGAGKTEVARRLVTRCPVRSVVVDTDAIAGIQPWTVDDRLFALIAGNLRACLAGYRQWGAEVVVVSGVLLVDGVLAHLGDLLDDPDLDWVHYGLRAQPWRLAERIAWDGKYQDAADRLSWSHVDGQLASVPGIHLIDTTHLGIEQVVDVIAEREFAPRAPVPADAVEVVEIPVPEASDVASCALRRAGLTDRLADEVTADLIGAELDRCPSHGLQRVPEYVSAIAEGAAQPDARPLVHHTDAGAAVVDAHRAMGVTVRRVVTEQLVELAVRQGFAIVGLRRSAHLGRLRSIATAVTARGLAVLGFVNCGGAGQKIAPPGHPHGRLATNPLVLGCPAPPGPPVIVDTSTSAISEGAVRHAAAHGRRLPPGLLLDPDGAPVRDPHALYSVPPGATIAPLGGVAAHRGFALSAAVEVFAGIVAGAGFAAAEPPPFSNGGLFVAFPADALGRAQRQIGADIVRLEQHLADGGPNRDGQPARLPGRRAAEPPPTSVRLPAALWTQIRRLAAEPTRSTR